MIVKLRPTLLLLERLVVGCFVSVGEASPEDVSDTTLRTMTDGERSGLIVPSVRMITHDAIS